MRAGIAAALAVSAALALALAGTAYPASAGTARAGSGAVLHGQAAHARAAHALSASAGGARPAGGPGGSLGVARLPAGPAAPADGAPVVLPLAEDSRSAPAAMALRADIARQRRAAVLRARLPGELSGTVRATSGNPLAEACVTAYGVGGTATGRTGPGGRFSISGLRAGRYTLEFRDCARPGRYWPEWSGGAMLSAMARQVRVRAGRTTAIPPVTLRPAGGAALFTRPPVSVRTAGQRPGGIAGRLTGPNGKPATGTCVEIITSFGFIGVPVSARGTYSTGIELPPGRYKVKFASLDCNANPHNWAQQWYRRKASQAAANWVRVRAGRITRNISARLVHGAIIAGTVTNQRGAKLKGVCVGLFGPGGDELAQRVTHRGGYRFWGLPTGGYRLLFEPSCRHASTYLPQWYRNKQSFRKATPVRVRVGHSVAGIDARLKTGGSISGIVRFKSSSGKALRGICVDATLGNVETGTDSFTTTGAGGRYLIQGLPAGTYTVQFSTGCNNNGNYLDATYPHPVVVAAGKAVRAINIALQPGGVMRGTVTGPQHQRLAHIAVIAQDNSTFNEGAACTGPSGTYTITQLPPGRYTVEFINGLCGHGGNWAPQFYPNQADPDAAVPVKVGHGQTVTGINATMRPGSTISGTVTTSAEKPVSKLCVLAQAPADAAANVEIGGPFAGTEAQTGKTGSYAIRNLAAGRYAVEFGPCGGVPGYVDRWFGGRPGTATGDFVDVGAGATAAGINAAVVRGGAITSAIRSSKGTPVSSSCEVLTNRKTGEVTSTIVAFGGTDYQIGGLAPGLYTVKWYTCEEGAGYAAQWYNRKSTPQAATPVRVSAGRTTGRINASLVKGGKITGRLTAKGKPVVNFCVTAESPSGAFVGFGETRKNGDYTVHALNTGTYHLTFSDCNASPRELADFNLTRTVHVTAPKTTGGVNAVAPPGGSVSGTVRAGSPAAGQGNVCVEADPVNARQAGGFATTSHSGHYTIANLAAGRYGIFFDTRGDCDNSQGGLVPQWFEDAATKAGATIVTVTAGQNLPGIGATLRADGGISGKVTAKASGDALGGVCVRAVPQAAGRAASFTTTAGGSYSLTGLIPGTYTVQFSSGCGATGLATQWWDDKSSAGSATVITVKSGAVTTGIDAAMTS